MYNLRQMAQAALSYAANNKQCLPLQYGYDDGTTSGMDYSVSNPLNGITNNSAYHPDWLGAIYPYMKAAKLMVCPAHPKSDEIASTAMSANDQQVIRTYTANGVVLTNGGKNIRHSAEIILFKDDGSINITAAAILRPHWRPESGKVMPTDGVAGWSGWMYFGSPTDPNAAPSGKITDKYHKTEKQCLSFVDGHAEIRHWKDINCLAFGLEPYVNGSGQRSSTRPPSAGTRPPAGCSSAGSIDRPAAVRGRAPRTSSEKRET